MKVLKNLILILVLLFSFVLIGCSSDNTDDNNDDNNIENNNQDNTNDDNNQDINQNHDDRNYSVKVVYPDNTSVNGGVFVMWCKGDTCYAPEVVNEDGVAKKKLEEDSYYIHIEEIPAGYTYDPNGYVTTVDSKNIEIKLIKLENISGGEGTAEAPYEVSTGAYTLQYEEQGNSGMKYYSFKAPAAGTYVIESLAQDKLALNAVDPYLGFLVSSSNDLSNIDISGNQDSSVNKNFKYEFVAEADATYTFIVFVSSATKFPAKFDINIYQK